MDQCSVLKGEYNREESRRTSQRVPDSWAFDRVCGPLGTAGPTFGR